MSLNSCVGLVITMFPTATCVAARRLEGIGYSFTSWLIRRGLSIWCCYPISGTKATNAPGLEEHGVEVVRPQCDISFRLLCIQDLARCSAMPPRRKRSQVIP